MRDFIHFVTAAPDRGEWSTLGPARFTTGQGGPVPTETVKG
jgi:hypothetical protein